MFGLIYLKIESDVQCYNAKNCHLSNDTVIKYKIIINGKSFYEQAIISDIKRYKEIRTLTIGQCEGYIAQDDCKTMIITSNITMNQLQLIWGYIKN